MESTKGVGSDSVNTFDFRVVPYDQVREFLQDLRRSRLSNQWNYIKKQRLNKYKAWDTQMMSMANQQPTIFP